MRPCDILVIEDSVEPRRARRSTGPRSDRMRIANDARCGVAPAREQRPDVILCDIGLPDVDGYEVAWTVRAEAVSPASRSWP